MLGEHDTTSDSDGARPQEINIISKVAHEAFDTKTFQNDVAVLKLARRVEFNSKWRRVIKMKILLLKIRGVVHSNKSSYNPKKIPKIKEKSKKFKDFF